ncbi:unnamed protein product, partial [Ixodes hexagonus]
HVCTGWAHHNVKGTNVSWLASKRFVEKVENALKSTTPSTEVETIVDMVVILYQSCVVSTTAPLTSAMKNVFEHFKIGNWPNFEPTDWESFDVFGEFVHADINSGMMILFKFERSYRWDAHAMRAAIRPSPHSCPYEQTSSKTMDPNALELEYMEYVEKVFELFKHTYAVAAREVAKIQISLCNVLTTKNTQGYHPFSDIVVRTKTLDVSEDDWLKALKPLGKLKQSSLLHTNIDYIETALNLILKATPEIAMKFMGFAILEQLSWAHDDLHKIRQRFSFVRDPMVGSAVPTDSCSRVILTHFRKAWNIFSLTVANSKDVVQNDVDKLIQSIKSAAIRRVRTSSWMDEASKSRTISKLIRTTVLSPVVSSYMKTFKMSERYTDLEAFSENFYDNMLKIRKNDAAFLVSGLMRHISEPNYALAGGDVSMDRVSTLAGLVQLPFYAHDLPLVIKYGGIGAIAGGLVARIITGKGSLRNEIGTTTNWWTVDAYREYKRRTSCFAKQVDPNAFQKEEPSYLADYLGLRIAFDALQYARMERKTHWLLPTFVGTDVQLFFITYCLGLCGTVDNEGEMSLPLQSLRRCNEAVKNMPEFAEAFRCPNTTAVPKALMNPYEKCELY